MTDEKPWTRWIPNRKVTAGAMAGAVAFILMFAAGKAGWITPAEALILGSAITTVVAYWTPER